MLVRAETSGRTYQNIQATETRLLVVLVTIKPFPPPRGGNPTLKAHIPANIMEQHSPPPRARHKESDRFSLKSTNDDLEMRMYLNKIAPPLTSKRYKGQGGRIGVLGNIFLFHIFWCA